MTLFSHLSLLLCVVVVDLGEAKFRLERHSLHWKLPLGHRNGHRLASSTVPQLPQLLSERSRLQPEEDFGQILIFRCWKEYVSLSSKKRRAAEKSGIYLWKIVCCAITEKSRKYFSSFSISCHWKYLKRATRESISCQYIFTYFEYSEYLGDNDSIMFKLWYWRST